MNCQEFDARFQAMLDLRQDPSHNVAINEHVAACPGCAGLMNAFAEVRELWDEPNEHAAAVGSNGVSLSGRMSALPEGERSTGRRLLAWTAAIASAALVVMVLLQLDDSRSEQPGGSALVAVEGLQSSVGEAADAAEFEILSSLPVEAAAVPLDLVLLACTPSQLIDGRYSADFSLPAEVWEGPVSGSLQPVAASFASTYNVLRARWPI